MGSEEGAREAAFRIKITIETACDSRRQQSNHKPMVAYHLPTHESPRRLISLTKRAEQAGFSAVYYSGGCWSFASAAMQASTLSFIISSSEQHSFIMKEMNVLISLFGRRVIISHPAGSLQLDGHSVPVSVGWRCPFGASNDKVNHHNHSKESFAHVLYEGTGMEQPGKSFLLMQRFYTRLQRVAESRCHCIVQYDGIRPEQFLMSFEQYRRLFNGTWMTSKKSEGSSGVL